MELPHWTDIVKTGTFKELAPYDADWYYVRAASMARKIYLRQGLGVGGYRKIYGGSKRNGSRPPHFCKSSGSVARNILHQLQSMNIVDLDPKGSEIPVGSLRGAHQFKPYIENGIIEEKEMDRETSRVYPLREIRSNRVRFPGAVREKAYRFDGKGKLL
ncbi:hypothetical protein ACHQM5_009932 [Ranunculus cassubicifolius]